MLKLFRFLLVLLIATPAFAQVPGPPLNFSQSVSGTTVTLTWSPPSTGGVPTGYQIEAAFSPGGAVIATLSIAGTTAVVPNVPVGTYFVRVRALNGGAASAPSNEVTVTVGGSTGCPAPPLPPTLRVRSVGQQATVTWASSGGCAPTDFTLAAGSAPGLSNVTVVNAGGQLGLSAIAPFGNYFVRVLGTNAFGSALSQEMQVRVAPNAETDTLLSGEAVKLGRQVLQSGTYQAVLVWDDPTINLDLYLATPGCTSFPPAGCQLSASTLPTGATEQVSRAVTAGQTFELWVGNLSGRATSFTIFSTINGAPAINAPVIAGRIGTGAQEPDQK